MTETDKIEPKVESAVLLANKFDEKRKFRWLIQMNGVDAFSVADLSVPQLEYNDGFFAPRGPFTLGVYARKGAELWLAKVLGTTQKAIRVSFLDSCGVIIDTMNLIDVEVGKSLGKIYLTYADDDPIVWRFSLSPSRVEFETGE
jgi:hypothetical protein